MNEVMMQAYQVQALLQHGVPAAFMLAAALWCFQKPRLYMGDDPRPILLGGVVGIGLLVGGLALAIEMAVWALAPMVRLVPMMVEMLEKAQ